MSGSYNKAPGFAGGYLLSAKSAEKFPFDIQHHRVIRYSLDSNSDFKALGDGITNRLNAILKSQENRQEIVAISKANPTTTGLRPHELPALAFLVSSSESVGHRVPIYAITRDMENAGYNKLATRLALSNLSKMEYILLEWERNERDEMYALYSVTDAGETWLLENSDTLDLNVF